MDEVSQGVSEGWRGRGVVKEVPAGGKGAQDSTTPSLDGTTTGLHLRKGLIVGVAASVKLGKVKWMKNAAKSPGDADGNEKDQVDEMEVELKRCETFIRNFAKETVDWTWKMKHLMTSLYAWADAFGPAIGIMPDSVPDAFDAFKVILRTRIIPVCEDLEKVAQERLLPRLSLLVDSTNNPLRVLEAMHTLEPLHYGLLNLDLSKSSLPASLWEASRSYVALRRRLSTELPQYLDLLQKGISAAIVQLSV